MVFVRNNISGIVSVQLDGHRIVDICPKRMVVMLFGKQRNFSHKPEGFHKIAELKNFD